MILYKIRFKGAFKDSIFVLAKDFNEAEKKSKEKYFHEQIENIEIVASEEAQTLIP